MPGPFPPMRMTLVIPIFPLPCCRTSVPNQSFPDNQAEGDASEEKSKNDVKYENHLKSGN
ncbi:MAG: hypothetical protein Ct9H90mP8_0180 [Pseudomonadota bacterium]|nr:MAG: hypothetical protein Ct9H90mP8_0180 [Pseudomonadota bacterium]